MRRATLTIVLITMLVTFLIAIVACENSQYTNPIQTIDSVTLVNTMDGDQVYTDVEYISSQVYSVKPMAIMTVENAPVMLPNTSAPTGVNTCDMGGFTVTTDNDCSELSSN